MAQLQQKQFTEGQIIFREGAWEMCMYDIIHGKVGIYTEYGTPSQKRIAVLGVHDFFGEMGLVDAMPRSATAVAELETAVWVINGDDLNVWFQESPEKVVQVMRHLSFRTRDLTNDYMEVCKTIAELKSAEDDGKEKSSGLREKIHRFANIWRKNGRK